jgi:hypothetical protein
VAGDDVSVSEVEDVASVLQLLIARQLNDVEPILLQVPVDIQVIFNKSLAN